MKIESALNFRMPERTSQPMSVPATINFTREQNEALRTRLHAFRASGAQATSGAS